MGRSGVVGIAHSLPDPQVVGSNPRTAICHIIVHPHMVLKLTGKN